MARILGLDLGSHTVKAVLFETSMRTATPKAYAEVRRALEGDKAQTLRAALTTLLADNPLAADQVVVALPGPGLATHMLSLPFTDPKRLEATIGFEVEGQLPFDLSEAVYDYQVASQQERKSELLVGVVRKEEVRTLLAGLTELKVDPRLITHPALAYQNLLLALPQLFDPPQGDEAVAIVDIGHERTALAVGRPGVGVEFARTFSGGGRDLSRALAAEFQTSFEEAHHWKEAQGALGAAATGPEGARAAGAFVRGLQPLLRELRPSLKAYAARFRRQVGTVYLCGGTARLPGLEEQLSQDLSLPVRVLRLPADVTDPLPALAQPSVMQPYALALRGQASGSKAPRFNLRRGEFAFKGDYDYVKDKVGQLAAFAAVLVLLLITSGIVRNTVLARRVRQQEQMLCDITERVLGRCERNFEVALSLLHGKESPAAALPKQSAIGLLAEFAQRLPAETPVSFDDVVVNLDRIAAKGKTDSIKQIDTIVSALKTYRCFKEVKEGRTERSKDGTKTVFQLDIQVDCSDPTQPQG